MPMMVTSVSFAFMDFIPLILIDYYTSTSQVGLYSVAYRITQFISITLLMVNTITAPIFADLYHSNRMIELQKIVRQSSKLIFFSALLIAIIILATNEGILFLFGKVFSGANLVLIILVLAQLINAFCGSSGLLLNMVGQQALFRNISLLSSFFLCVLCLIFIPLLGILGASISVLINMVIWNFLSSMYVYKKIKIKSYFTIY